MENTAPALCLAGGSSDLQADRLPTRKGGWGPGLPRPAGRWLWSRPPAGSEAEEVLLLGAAAVGLVPVDGREALGVVDVLGRQAGVQDLGVRPGLGEPGRQSCVSRGASKGLAGA